MTAPSIAEPSRTWRRFMQFRLRWLLVVTIAVAAVLGWREFRERWLDTIAPTSWNIETGRNVKWIAELGTQSYGAPVVARGKVFVGTNNGHGYVSRYPASVDLGVLLCFNAATGAFLWQHSNPKLATGRANDWPLQGIVSRPLIEGDRLWYVTNRCEVVCLDAEGFRDGENDGQVQNEVVADDEADVVWTLDMFNTLGVRPHNMSTCSPAADDTRLFVVTSNGVDESHVNIPAPHAPSFLAIDKKTGKVLWSDNSPGRNTVHAEWGSPTYAVLGGVPQVIFPGGDGWVYSFDPAGTPDGRSRLLWRFDMNPKRSNYRLGGRGTFIVPLLSAVVYRDRVYLTGGDDPEHGEGLGHIYCIDPTRRGDISAELVFNASDPNNPQPPCRPPSVNTASGDYVVANPNSGIIWHFDSFDRDGDGAIEFEEEMHRTLGNVVIQDGWLFAADFSGLVHCLDAATGRQLASRDVFAACWATPLISGQHLYVGDEEGKMSIFPIPTDRATLAFGPIAEIDMTNSIYCTPTASKRVLYIVNKTHLFAIEEGAQSPPPAWATGS